MAASFISTLRRHLALLLAAVLGQVFATPAAVACSFAFTEMPYGPEQYVFYGRVTGYTTFAMDVCGRDPQRRGAECPPAWGWVLEVVEAVHLPKPVHELEYFEFTVDAACGPLPLGESHVQRIPVGSLVTLVAAGPKSWVPKGRLPRLSAPTPVNGLLAALPAGADPRALARADPDPRDTACLHADRWPDGRLAFEYWRDRHALEREKSEPARLDRLVRMMSAFDERYFPRSARPTMHEDIVLKYLQTAAARDEFYARLPAARAAAHAACRK